MFDFNETLAALEKEDAEFYEHGVVSVRRRRSAEELWDSQRDTGLPSGADESKGGKAEEGDDAGEEGEGASEGVPGFERVRARVAGSVCARVWDAAVTAHPS